MLATGKPDAYPVNAEPVRPAADLDRVAAFGKVVRGHTFGIAVSPVLFGHPLSRVHQLGVDLLPGVVVDFEEAVVCFKRYSRPCLPLLWPRLYAEPFGLGEKRRPATPSAPHSPLVVC